MQRRRGRRAVGGLVFQQQQHGVVVQVAAGHLRQSRGGCGEEEALPLLTGAGGAAVPAQ